MERMAGEEGGGRTPIAYRVVSHRDFKGVQMSYADADDLRNSQLKHHTLFQFGQHCAAKMLPSMIQVEHDYYYEAITDLNSFSSLLRIYSFPGGPVGSWMTQPRPFSYDGCLTFLSTTRIASFLVSRRQQYDTERSKAIIIIIRLNVISFNLTS